LIGISLLGLALTTTTAGVYGAMALFGSGFGLLFPAVTSYIADHSSPSERGMAYGVFYAAYSLGVVAGEVGSGQLAEVFGAATVAPFVAFGCLALFVTPWVVMVNRRVAPVRAIAPAQ
jgi:MFS family permease